MQSIKRYHFHTKTQNLPIHKKEQDILKDKQYDLKKNIFDPSNSSPPNFFLEKLRLRIKDYEFSVKNCPTLESK
jgi:hypothetical protein